MFKKFLLVITTIVVLFSFVTYQPKKVDAFASTAVKVVAQQTLKAATKSVVDETVQKMLVKELLEEVTESYAKKQGYKLVESGGQRMYMKSTFNQTEKVVLKNKIDDVINQQVYGSTPKFLQYLDWFVGVGAIISVGQVLYAGMTGELESYLSQIITDAMIQLGWLTPALPKDRDPKDPTGFEKEIDVPIINYDPNISYNDPMTKHVVTYNQSSSQLSYSQYTGQYQAYYKMNFPEPYLLQGSIFVYEIMPSSSSGFGASNVHVQMPAPSFDFPIRVLGSQMDSVVFPTGQTSVYINGLYQQTFDTAQTPNVYYPQYVSSKGYASPRYNRYTYQDYTFDKSRNTYVARLILQDTLYKTAPDLTFVHYKNQNASNATMTRVTFTQGHKNSPHYNPVTVKIGYYRNLDLATSQDMLPAPKIDPTDIKPVVTTSDGKLPIPQKTILPDGYTYDPAEQVIKSPDGQVVTNPESLDLPNPDPVITEGSDGNVEIDGTPTDIPVPPGGITPPTNGDGTGGGMETGDPTKINWAKLKAVPMILTKKFPFSLPWDAKRFMEGVFGEVPAAEEFSLKIDKLMGVDFNLNVTMPEYFDGWFAFSRTATVILFDIALIYALYRLLGGAS